MWLKILQITLWIHLYSRGFSFVTSFPFLFLAHIVGIVASKNWEWLECVCSKKTRSSHFKTAKFHATKTLTILPHKLYCHRMKNLDKIELATKQQQQFSYALCLGWVSAKTSFLLYFLLFVLWLILPIVFSLCFSPLSLSSLLSFWFV